jgi:hypothetical protein
LQLQLLQTTCLTFAAAVEALPSVVFVLLLLLQVGFAAFREFVVSREAGLREAFSQFDLGEADQQRYCLVT